MPGFQSITASDLYGRYLALATEAEAGAALEELFSQWLVGWCRDSVERNLACYGLRDVDRVDLASDISAEVLLAIATRLSASRAGTAEPVGNVRAYLASVAQNACFARIRARCPQHVQLQNRIRYLLRSDVRFAAWESSDGEPLAGLSHWTDRLMPVSCPELQRTVAPLDQTMESLFTLAEGPVRMTDALRSLSAAFGITDSNSASIDPDSVASGERQTDQLLVERESLESLWREVRDLPASQRTALLLNLRDPSGNGVIELLPATGMASFPELAAMLGMTPTELAAIWNDLPLEDARIATLLGLSRQQVINLRKSARDRLGRRLRKAEGNTVRNFSSNENVGILGRTGKAIGTIFRGAGDH